MFRKGAFGGLWKSASQKAPTKGPKMRLDADGLMRKLLAEPVDFMADFPGFFNLTRTLAEVGMVPLR